MVIVFRRLGKTGQLIKQHLERNKKIYVTIGYAVAASVILDPSAAFANIDTGGHRIHAKLCTIGKWVIVIKGSIDTIQSILNGDFSAAKQHFWSYLMCFSVLLGLPWILDQIEGVFKE